ncbi:arginine--tRNA ligase [bacterium]
MIKIRLKQVILDIWNELSNNAEISFQIEIPPAKIEADYAVNICMIGAKLLKKSPHALAQRFIEKINELKEAKDIIKKASIAGPGFLNIILNKKIYYDELCQIFDNGSEYGKEAQGIKQRVLIEFVSANPTGPLHIGHGRGAVLGDTLSRLLHAKGFEVVKEYYVNDSGNQIDVLAKSLEIRLRQVRGEKIVLPEDYYKGDYIIDIAKKINHDFGQDKDITSLDFKKAALDNILELIKKDLREFGIEYNSWFYESDLFIKKDGMSPIERVLEILKTKKYLEKHDNAWWLLTKEQEHDDKNRVVVREDGRPTYFCTDIAYHDLKYKRGFDKLINIWGADHHGYVPRLKAVVDYMGYNPESLKIVLYQLVSLIRKGKKAAMSTRGGEFVTLKEVLDEVGSDVTRFFLLMRSSDNPMDFDLDLAKKQSNDNPVYYIQYAHARIASIYREARDDYKDYIDEAKNTLETLLNEAEEMKVIKMLVQFPDIIDVCVRDLAPHYMTVYLLDLAKTFHHYYTKHRILLSDDKMRAGARLILCHTVAEIIKSGLNLLGISAPERM